jgi:CubicO group peptidase (beta-lactamase class C family)
MSMDVLGAVIQVVTGQDLETAMRQRVFTPLGMTRTTFRPDAGLLAKGPKIHTRNAEGKLVEDQVWARIGSPQFASGGGGLFSTLHDYARFAQMLLNNGELDGHRVLGRKTVEIMCSNQISHLETGGWVPAGFGFGVRVQPDDLHSASAIRSPGAFGWDGAATTFVSMDPKERLFVLLMMQHVPYNEDRIFDRFENTIYGALK